MDLSYAYFSNTKNTIMYYNEDCIEDEPCYDPDYLYDSVRDDFLTEIHTEEDALDMIKRYPSMVRYLPKEYNYLLKGNNGK